LVAQSATNIAQSAIVGFQEKFFAQFFKGFKNKRYEVFRILGTILTASFNNNVVFVRTEQSMHCLLYIIYNI